MRRHKAAILTALATYLIVKGVTHLSKREEFPELPAALGDLVNVEGYGSTPFFVEAFRQVRNIEIDGEWLEVIVEVTDATTGQWLEADGEDLTVITDASQADHWLAEHYRPENDPTDIFNKTPNEKPPIIDIFGLLNGGANGMKKPEPKRPTQRELSSQEAHRRKEARKRKAVLIDRLLDQRNMYTELSVLFNGGYDGNLAQIAQDLTLLTGEELPASDVMDDVELRLEMRVEHRTYE